MNPTEAKQKKRPLTRKVRRGLATVTTLLENVSSDDLWELCRIRELSKAQWSDVAAAADWLRQNRLET